MSPSVMSSPPHPGWQCGSVCEPCTPSPCSGRRPLPQVLTHFTELSPQTLFSNVLSHEHRVLGILEMRTPFCFPRGVGSTEQGVPADHCLVEWVGLAGLSQGAGATASVAGVDYARWAHCNTPRPPLVIVGGECTGIIADPLYPRLWWLQPTPGPGISKSFSSRRPPFVFPSFSLHSVVNDGMTLPIGPPPSPASPPDKTFSNFWRCTGLLMAAEARVNTQI